VGDENSHRGQPYSTRLQTLTVRGCWKRRGSVCNYVLELIGDEEKWEFKQAISGRMERTGRTGWVELGEQRYVSKGEKEEVWTNWGAWMKWGGRPKGEGGPTFCLQQRCAAKWLSAEHDIWWSKGHKVNGGGKKMETGDRVRLDKKAARGDQGLSGHFCIWEVFSDKGGPEWR